MKYAKPALSFEDQANLIQSRGMIIKNRAHLLHCLESVGYYRLCAYWHPFKQPDNSFSPNTDFDVVWLRYRFDRQLRLLVMDAIERVEVAIRTALVHDLAMRAGAFAHIDIVNFPGVLAERHSSFVEKLRDDTTKSKEVFVQHFQKNYDEFPDLPVWAVCETMTFGSMFTLFNMTDFKTRNVIAKRYGLYGPVLFSWLQTLNYIRNICAHHSRLWNRELAIKPTIPHQKNDPRWHGAQAISNKRMFVVLTLLNQLLTKVATHSKWRGRLFHLFDTFPTIPIKVMGIPDGWRTYDLWK